MKKLLVTGASGFLGWNLCQHAKSSWQVFGTFNTHSIKTDGFTTIRIDLTNFAELMQLFRNIKPDAVIHLAAASQPNFCEQYPDISYKINVLVTENIASLCEQFKASFVFTSTDLVFDGKFAPYSEKDSVSPICIYGEHKIYAEEKILKCCPGAAICRMPLMFGDPSPYSKGSMLPILQSLENNKPVKLFTDEYRTILGEPSASSGLLHAINNFQGVIHLGGSERLSRYEFGVKLAKYCNLNQGLITGILQKEIIMAAPRPKDVSLNSSLAFSKGYTPFSTIEGFRHLKSLDKY